MHALMYGAVTEAAPVHQMAENAAMIQMLTALDHSSHSTHCCCHNDLPVVQQLHPVRQYSITMSLHSGLGFRHA